MYIQVLSLSIPLLPVAIPVHVQHGGKLKLVVDLLGPSERLVELKSGQFKGQHRREFSEPVLKDNRDVDFRES